MPPSPSPGDREALLRELADAIPQIVWTAGPDGLLTHVNARGAEYAGRPSGELHGQAWVEAIHPDDLPVAFAAKDDAVRTGAPREFEFRLRRADGVYRWHVSRQVPKLAADGTVAGWFGTCTDIDDLKQVQHALRDTEARLAESQRIARLGSWRWDAATGHVWWSDAMFDLFGVDRRIGHPTLEQFLARLHPDSRAMMRALVERRGTEHADFEADLQIVRDDGTTAWVHSRGRVTRTADGAVRHMDGTDQDITDRKHTESALQASEQRYRRLMDLLPTAVMVQDGARVLYCNPAFIRLVGAASADEVKARPLFEWVHPDDQALARARLAELVATGEPLPNVEIRLRHVSGRPVPTYGTSTPITGYGPQAYLIALSDLTERERATQLLRTVLGSVSDAILTIDAHGIVQSANEAAARQFGRTADTLIGASLEIRRRHAERDGLAFARGLVAMGWLRAEQSELEEADSLVRTAVALLERSPRTPPAELAAALRAQGGVLELKGDYARAIEVLTRSARLDSLAGTSAAEASETLTSLANNHFYSGHLEIADSLNRRVLALDRAVHGDRHPHVASDLLNLGAVQFEWGRWAEAERYDREALAIYRAWYGEQHYETAASLTMLGRALIAQDELAEADSVLRRALRTRERVFGSSHPSVASTLNELARVAQKQKRFDDAEAGFRRMLAIYRESFGEKHYLIGLALTNIGAVQMDRGRPRDAEPLFRDALKRYAETLPEDHAFVGIGRLRLGRSLLRQRRYEEALTESKAGYELLGAREKAPQEWLRSGREDLVAEYEALGRPNEARALRKDPPGAR